MTIDDVDDLAGLSAAGRVVADVRDAMLAAVEPGITTGELDAIGRGLLRATGARSAPRLAYGFPGSTCISVNHEAAHGVPSRLRPLRSGDLVNIDVSAELDGYWADTGASTAVGTATERAVELLDATRLAQADAMAAAVAGAPLRHVGRVVERRARRHGFTVVADLLGHGVGRSIHESPNVSSVEDRSDRTILWEGLVLAIEPFLAMGATHTVEGDDGWTLLTDDGGLVAQFEHTVVITDGHPLVLTASAA
ncbi:type I methionyl aminopeptidase [Aquihabitans sp. G128]|uniref:type I methionyl aminopeptidase n=1 Tax=Aquihabitans sp. G128 TaxID=2849779 RepID=UPI001C2218A5|nr:type I methionyl aminopeptidase [Aquihabitans sp. G128]QXC62234.1 type I methionyl aminopeptidase [Aquihabitans sp. G128]